MTDSSEFRWSESGPEKKYPNVRRSDDGYTDFERAMLRHAEAQVAAAERSATYLGVLTWITVVVILLNVIAIIVAS